jgi:hypothetical protein
MRNTYKNPAWVHSEQKGAMLTSGVVLLHDDGRLHRAAGTQSPSQNYVMTDGQSWYQAPSGAHD